MPQKGHILILGLNSRTRFDFLRQISGLTPEAWEESFIERTAEDVGSPRDAMQKAKLTLILGHDVRDYMALPEAPWILPQTSDNGPWRFLPVPSGRTQIYNDPVFRAAVRLLLQEVAT